MDGLQKYRNIDNSFTEKYIMLSNKLIFSKMIY